MSTSYLMKPSKHQLVSPSGLSTHMNTHNNIRRACIYFSSFTVHSHYIKAYPCVFPGCERTFAVRSNAKRHLKIHGPEAEKFLRTEKPTYLVNFEDVQVSDEPLLELPSSPVTWAPPASLEQCKNFRRLISVREDLGFSDEDGSNDGDMHKDDLVKCFPVSATRAEVKRDDEELDEEGTLPFELSIAG